MSSLRWYQEQWYSIYSKRCDGPGQYHAISYSWNKAKLYSERAAVLFWVTGMMPLKQEMWQNLNFVNGQMQCSVGDWVFACFQSCGMVALFWTLVIMQRGGGGESGYWSAGGIFRAITLMHLMSGCSDATSLPCVLAVKSWLNVISVYQVLQESQIIAKSVLALTDKRQIPLANFLRGWFSFCSH